MHFSSSFKLEFSELYRMMWRMADTIIIHRRTINRRVWDRPWCSSTRSCWDSSGREWRVLGSSCLAARCSEDSRSHRTVTRPEHNRTSGQTDHRCPLSSWTTNCSCSLEDPALHNTATDNAFHSHVSHAITRKAHGRAHVPPTKVFRRLGE